MTPSSSSNRKALVAARLSRPELRRITAGVATAWSARSAAVDTSAGYAQPKALAETLEIWTVDHGILHDLPPMCDLRDAARPTRRWHHQIMMSDGTFAMARSTRGPGEPGTVKSLHVGAMAMTIHNAFDWLDALGTTRSVVRLLSIPQTGMVALWIVPRWSGGPTRLLAVANPRLVSAAEWKLVSSSEVLHGITSSITDLSTYR